MNSEERKNRIASVLRDNDIIEFVDPDTAYELASEISYNLNIFEDASLNAFKNIIKGDPQRISEPAEILVNTLSDREYMLIMHIGNKIIDCMIEYAHRQVSVIERKYEDKIEKQRKSS